MCSSEDRGIRVSDPTQQAQHTLKRKALPMEIVWILGFLAVWFALQMWILPKFGVST